jgi:hypothetical protein
MDDSIADKSVEIGERPRNHSSINFIISAGAILAITGIAKVWSGLGTAKVLAVADPIIGVQFGHLMLVVGIAEIVVALICLFCKWHTLALGLVAWLATNFVVYRFGLIWVGYHKPCPCLGNLTDALHISPQTADTGMKIILGYLLLGSYASLFWLWRQEGNDSLVPPASEKAIASAP